MLAGAAAWVGSASFWAAAGGSSCGRAGGRVERQAARRPQFSAQEQHAKARSHNSVRYSEAWRGYTGTATAPLQHATAVARLWQIEAVLHEGAHARHPGAQRHLTLRNQRTPTSASSSTHTTFFFFSLRGCGSGDGTRRAAAAARSFALDELGPTVERGSSPPLLPPSMVTPLPRLPSPPREAKGLALTLEMSVSPAAPPELLLSALLLPPAACWAAPPLADAGWAESDAGLAPRVGSTVIVLIVTVCSGGKHQRRFKQVQTSRGALKTQRLGRGWAEAWQGPHGRARRGSQSTSLSWLRCARSAHLMHSCCQRQLAGEAASWPCWVRVPTHLLHRWHRILDASPLSIRAFEEVAILHGCCCSCCSCCAARGLPLEGLRPTSCPGSL